MLPDNYDGVRGSTVDNLRRSRIPNPRSRATTPASLPTVRTGPSLPADVDGDPSNVDQSVCAVAEDELPGSVGCAVS